MILIKRDYKITIDGPAGSGKSSLAKLLAKELNLIHLDTGSLYRSIALYFIENVANYNQLSEDEVKLYLPNIDIEYKPQQVFLNGQDISSKIRSNIVSQNASIFAAKACVRTFCNQLQQKIISENKNIVMDGRDCGTLIMPEADFKFFLKTNARVRALRRLSDQNKELSESNIAFLTKEIQERDKRDENREIAPLVPAQDAIILDNSNETLEQTFTKILTTIK